MTSSWDIRQLAVFSLEQFVFGVDARQIQEIITISRTSLTYISDAPPFPMIHVNTRQIPLLNLKEYWGLPASFSDRPMLSPLTCIIFSYKDLLIAFQISTIEHVLPVSLRSLQPVPHILNNFARKMGLWGFYEFSGTLIPLIDLAQIASEQAIRPYLPYLR